MKKQTVFELPLFALGFRAFFALAGMSALMLIGMWRSVYDGSQPFSNYYPSLYWHAHEMLIGYTVAVMAGFLLTAVRNWTGQSTPSGGKLAGLCLLWLYGRILPFYSEVLPDGFIALVDFVFLPVLAWQISLPIMQARHYRSLLFIALLLVMATGNGLIHAEILGLTEQTAWLGSRVIIACVITMILVIAGRVFPFFTERGLPGSLCIRDPLINGLSIASALQVFVLDLFAVSGAVLAAAAITAALINGYRVYAWYNRGIWYVPLLWILYLGYGWIILGFILMAFSAFGLLLPSLALHTFTIGGIGVITLGMMARVSLGHTGRVLKLSNIMAVGFVCINIAVFVRVLIPVASTDWYGSAVNISIWLWLVAFSLFIAVYMPILVQARPDGKPG
jgi:uncharacterized protein involved in response to NO